MSWDDYVKTMTAKGATQCGIYTKQGAPCAQSANFQITPEGVSVLKQITEGTLGGKIEINGHPCTMISYDADEGYVQAKTKNPVMNDSKVFYHVESTNYYLVVSGMYGAGERNACSISHDICKYLKGLNQ